MGAVTPDGDRTVRLRVTGTDLAVRIGLLPEQNPATCDLVWDCLPLETIIGHVVVSGGGLWIPTRATYTGPRVAVPRRRGSVYFYPPMQAICLTYGAISESAFVNEFGRVPDEDLDTLTAIGRHVWDTTIIHPARAIVRVSLDRAEGSQ
jgi:hypothetical protein